MTPNDYVNWPYCHDLMVIVIKDHYPGLVPGRDFSTAHPVDLATDGPAGDPFIARWTVKDIEQPKDDDIKALFMADEARYRAIFVRTFRDECLEWCDAKAVVPADAPASLQARADKWLGYRQALRDVPQQAGFPTKIDWPDLPT